MQSRFLNGWRVSLLAVAVTSLVLLPFSATLAKGPQSVLNNGDAGGLRLAEKQKDDGPTKVVSTYSRANYVWPYASGPYYGDVESAARRDAGVIVTPVGTFRLGTVDSILPGELKSVNQLNQLGAQYFIVAIDPAGRTADTFVELEQLVAEQGGALVQPMAVGAVVARLTPSALAAVQGSINVLAVEPFHAAFKLDPLIGRTPLIDPVKAVSDIYSLELRLFPGEDAQAVAGLVAKLGANVTSITTDTIYADINRSRLAQLAAIEAVQAIHEALPLLPHAEETTTAMQTGGYNAGATPYHDAGVDGSGGGIGSAQILMVLDSGIQLDAGDLSDTGTDAGTAGVSHRKVRHYSSTVAFGGSGDLLGCDALPQGGFTHGHTVSATALGSPSIDPDTGNPWLATDPNGEQWGLDGVAPGALLVAYDGQITPAVTSCSDPLQDTITPGDLYAAPSSGSLGVSYTTHGARLANFSWGADSNSYTANAADIDQFLFDKRDAMVFVSAGNAGADTDNNNIPDEGTLGTPATTKNGLAIGASRATTRTNGNVEGRQFFSSMGPTPSGRIAPQLMAPGGEGPGGTGVASEFSCRSNDNDQANPVGCDIIPGVAGTSFSSPAATGAAALIRDYFAQGNYPDGTSANTNNAGDVVSNVSGALIKSILIASADFMTGANLTRPYRFNNEQGYGRIVLDKVLPLDNWPASATGLVVADGGIVGGVNNVGGSISGTINAVTGATQSSTFQVCNPNQELRVALSWLEGTGDALINDLDLEVESPSGKIYYGNYYTDDDNRDGAINATTEDCPSINGTTNTVSSSQWSLPICQRADLTLSPHDSVNPTEAVHLSPDPLGNGTFSQIEVGTWTVRVVAKNTGADTAQRYALAIGGGVCIGSSVRFDDGAYTCNAQATVTVSELSETGDVSPTPAQVSSRTVVEVLDGNGVVQDTETGLTFTATGLSFEADPLILTAGTARDPGNGVLDVRNGDTIRVSYHDVDSSGNPDANKVRRSSAAVDCDVRIGFGNITFAQFGEDTSYFVAGGCERNARGLFEFGFPDRYMDAGEAISFNFAFASNEQIDLENVEVGLACVVADGDSPAECRPNSTDCPDPNRLNNVRCDQSGLGYMTILDSPKSIGLIPAGAALSANFSIAMANSIPGTPDVEMLLSVTADSSGKSSNGLAVSQHKLDVDEVSVFYSTDFPTGGTEYRDRNNNETLENPTTNIGDFLEDYRFETITYSDLTAGGTKNTTLQSPWNFDVTDGGFRSGIGASTDFATIGGTIAQWGEDLNFNNIDDKRCSNDASRACVRGTDCVNPGTCNSVEQRDPADAILDKSWNTQGGCGWQTRAPGSCSNQATRGCYTNGDCLAGGTCNLASPQTRGGIWHTGKIYGTTGTCLVTGNNPGQCQTFETVAGATGQRLWFELLVTPEVQKVGGDDQSVQIINFAWNQAVDLPDDNVAWSWEFDTDTATLEPVDLISDLSLLNFLFGGFGAANGTNNPDLTDGYSMFAPLTGTASSNGTAGNNRVGKNSCFFEGTAVGTAARANLGFARPPDDDIDNNGGSSNPDLPGVSIDEFVTNAGPIRNMDLFAVNGPDMRFSTLEDIYGKTGDAFQAGIGILNFEKTDASVPDPAVGYGIGVDDVVMEWREFSLLQDTTDCAAGGECAVVDVQTSNFFEGNSLITITVLEKTPDAFNDCDLDGTPDGTNDCDGDGTPDVVVKATSSAEVAGEIVFLNQTSNPNEYKGDLPVSTLYDVPGVLFLAPSGQQAPAVTVTYLDNDDGTGQICKNDVDPAAQGRVQASTTLFATSGNVLVLQTILTDNGDNDGWADTNETVNMKIRVSNKSGVDLTGLTARLSTNDPKIDCIINPSISIGDLADESDVFSTEEFVFRVANVDRTTLGLSDLDDFSAKLNVILSSNEIDASTAPQSVTLDLDLDATGGSGPTSYSESFESGTFGSFTTSNLDAGRNSEVASEGFRCQYSDPDWVNSNSYGAIFDCWLGASGPQADAYFWQVHTTSAVDGGRAYAGNNSLYMGIFGAAADEHTTPVAVLEAIRTNNPINLAFAGGAVPELTFYHQVSFVDGRSVGPLAAPRGADRAVLELQLADGAGNAVGSWIKLQPYQNTYDQQAADNFTNCLFDPVDDGNTEDDFFDPTDPDRRLGPSSTCFPEFSFVHQGDTFNPFSEANIGRATDGPGLAGSRGLGTWIESKVNLERFRGRRVRLRFVNTAIKLGSTETWQAAFTHNPDPGDDGVWIDALSVSDTLTSPATVSNDNKDNSALPGCGATCNTVTANLEATPAGTLAAPGQVVSLTAVNSMADRCVGGTLQFQYWIDGNGDNAGGDPADTLVRSWTDNPDLLEAPAGDTTYVVDVRCSSDLSCADSAHVFVAVACPSSGNLGAAFPTVTAPDKTSLSWGSSINYDFATGLLSGLSSYTTSSTGQNQGPASSFGTGGSPASGTGVWFLFRTPGALGGGGGFCNEPGNSWGNAGRDAALP